MPILHDVEQGSEAWDRLRIGIPTSSEFHRIVTPGGKRSKQWKSYVSHLIAERIAGRKIDFYKSEAMERGSIVEAEAADWYEFDRNVDLQKIGFITNDEGTIGCSPDRLVGDDGLLEIKSPKPPAQIEYWLFDETKERHWPQVQGQLYISRRSWVDLMCWHEAPFPKVIMRAEPDEKYIKTLHDELQMVCFFIERCMEKIRSMTELPVPQNRIALKAALKDALRASLEAS